MSGRRPTECYIIAEKAVCRSVFLTIWHYVLSAKLTKTHSSYCFFWWFCPLGCILIFPFFQ